MKRLRELDFLRGIAILLVLLRHQEMESFTKTMGWIGVDLFFVLSGFLVSGLLFKEYQKFGDIQPKRFLIRRGFKIYPVYYLFYILYLIPILLDGKFFLRGLLADLTFTQNYLLGWGYAYAASWSLAVEEHFYFGLSLSLWLALKYKKITLKKEDGVNNKISSLEITILAIMAVCLALRFISNTVFPGQYARNATMTHLRIDSLLTGVLIAYLYYFRLNYISGLFKKYRYLLLAIACAGVSWTPFLEPEFSFFVKTTGFTLLYISFGILLLYFILEPQINRYLNRIFSAAVVNVVSKIGYCSYSIYIIHTLVNMVAKRVIAIYHLYNNPYLNFCITSILSIAIGMFMTHRIETYFLRLRNKYYPARA
jgi:peptidoglycan/LPS O-acetylase OafA/YrhL